MKVVNLNGKECLAGLINPRSEEDNTAESISKAEHAAEPIKDLRDIKLMEDYFRSNCQYRNLMYFILGIYTGLRVSDMLRLKFGDLINDDLTWRDEIIIEEKKTKNTLKRRKNRHIAINAAVKSVIKEYLENTNDNIDLDTYLFRSESNNGRNLNKPIHRNKVDDFLKKAAHETGVATRVKVSTHTTRKTFSYHTYSMTGDISMLRKILNHSSDAITLAYSGILSSDIHDIYLDLNYDESPQNGNSLTA